LGLGVERKQPSKKTKLKPRRWMRGINVDRTPEKIWQQEADPSRKRPGKNQDTLWGGGGNRKGKAKKCPWYEKKEQVGVRPPGKKKGLKPKGNDPPKKTRSSPGWDRKKGTPEEKKKGKSQTGEGG